MSTLIRPYRPHDTAALWRLSASAASPARFHLQVAEKAQAWTIEENGHPVGFAVIDDVPGLPGLFGLDGGILPAYRRRGLGSRLLEAVLKAARRNGVTVLTHPVSELDSPGARFLNHCGFLLEHVELRLERRLEEPLPTFAPNPQLVLSQLERSAVAAQLPQLYDRCFYGTPWYQPYTHEEIEATLTPHDEVWLLEAGGEPIGFAWLHALPGGVTEIEPLGMVREQRGVGYGRYLLNALVHKQKARAKRAIRLTVWQQNEAALALYRSAGFVEDGKSFYLAKRLLGSASPSG